MVDRLSGLTRTRTQDPKFTAFTQIRADIIAYLYEEDAPLLKLPGEDQQQYFHIYTSQFMDQYGLSSLLQVGPQLLKDYVARRVKTSKMITLNHQDDIYIEDDNPKPPNEWLKIALQYEIELYAHALLMENFDEYEKVRTDSEAAKKYVRQRVSSQRIAKRQGRELFYE